MGAMLGLVALVLIMGLVGRFAGACRHISLVHSLRRDVGNLVALIGHSGRGSSAGSVGYDKFASHLLSHLNPAE